MSSARPLTRRSPASGSRRLVRDDGRLAVVTAVGDDRSNRVLHPVRHPVSAQVVQDNDLGFERSTVGFLVAGAGHFVVAATDTIQKILKIEEGPLEPPRQQPPRKDGDGEMGFSGHAGCPETAGRASDRPGIRGYTILRPVAPFRDRCER